MSISVGILIFLLVLTGSVKKAQAGWLVNNRNWLVYEADEKVLGEEKKEERHENRQDRKEEKVKVEYFDAGKKAWIKAETEDGEKTELGEDEELEIEEKDDNKIRVATGSSEKEMVFSRNRIKAKTNFPLSVDLNTNELIVTTPAGTKRVTVLPDQAIANLITNKIFDRLTSENQAEMELTEEDGVPTYEVAGESDQKLLGLLPVKIKSKVKVSAESGEVLKTEKSTLARLMDFISF